MIVLIVMVSSGLMVGCQPDTADCGNGRGEVGAAATVRALLDATVEGDVDRACDMIGGIYRPGRTGLEEPLEDLAQALGGTPVDELIIVEREQMGSYVGITVAVPGKAPMEFGVVLDHNGRGQVLTWPDFPPGPFPTPDPDISPSARAD